LGGLVLRSSSGRAERLFEVLHAPRDRRLGELQVARGLAQRLRVDDGDERVDVIQFHAIQHEDRDLNAMHRS
jgi:hypothetical protein